jgi:hypothetical protein
MPQAITVTDAQDHGHRVNRRVLAGSSALGSRFGRRSWTDDLACRGNPGRYRGIGEDSPHVAGNSLPHFH